MEKSVEKIIYELETNIERIDVMLKWLELLVDTYNDVDFNDINKLATINVILQKLKTKMLNTLLKLFEQKNKNRVEDLKN